MNQDYNISQIKIGPMENFCYVISTNKSRNAYLIDPGWDAPILKNYLDSMQMNFMGILCTHHHYDHVNAIDDLLKDFDVPVYMLKQEAEFYNFKNENLKLKSSSERVSLGHDLPDIIFLHTPGHTVGSTSFLLEGHIFTGDTLFINGCGRCDLSGGDPEMMYHTLSKIITHLPNETIIHPGHDYGDVPFESIEGQLRRNPFFNHSTLDSFINYRMKGKK